MQGDEDHLQQLVADLKGNRQIVLVGEAVQARLKELADEMAEIIREEIFSYSQSANHNQLRSGWQHGFGHAQKIAELLQEKPVGDLEFVVAYAKGCAIARFPLNDILHTYRIGHRVMWRCMKDAAMRLATAPEEGLRTAMIVADFTIRYTNLISVVLTRAYTGQERVLNNTRARRSRLLFDDLAMGELRSTDARALAEALNIGRKPYYLVVFEAAKSGDSGGVRTWASLADTLDRRLAASGMEAVVDDRHGAVHALIVPQHPTPGSKARLLRRLMELAKEAGVYCGVSISAVQISDFSLAVSEAAAAIKHASASIPVVDLASVSFHEVFLDNRHLALERVLPKWFSVLADGDRNANGALRATIGAYADSDLSVKGAARKLGIHPNTVRFRLNKIEKITGVSPKSFRGLQELLTVLSVGHRNMESDLIARKAG